MISFTSKLKDEATPFLKKIEPALMKYLENYMKKDGADMEREIKQSLSIGVHQGGGIVRSKPGEPPHLEHGHLMASIASEIKVKKDEVVLNIGAIRGGKEVNYARGLEQGIPGKMAARPYLMPVAKRYYDQFKKFFNSRWKFK